MTNEFDVIDLRSDTVTKPTAPMIEAMARAEVGDDVLGDDPTVIALQKRCAALFGKGAACFVPSGTMANLCAIRAHTEPGDEIIAHELSHIIVYESGGYAAVGGCTVAHAKGERGQYEVGEIERLVRGDDHHYPRTLLAWLENTANLGGGSVWPLGKIESVSQAARARGLRVHIDGARIWNASVALGVSVEVMAQHADTVSACFSKGLGCPVGSIVVGDRVTIATVHRVRKLLGGAMRQSGMLAAAALYALDHHLERLQEDHDHARRLAAGLSNLEGLQIDQSGETNMVYMRIDSGLGTASSFCTALEERGVLMIEEGPQLVRAVAHLQVSSDDVERAIEATAQTACSLRAHSGAS